MAATAGQRVGAVTVGPHELLEIMITNSWPLLLRTDEATKRSLSLVCLNTCALLGDLERDVPARLHISPRTCQLNAFRRIEHLNVHGSCFNPLRKIPAPAPQLRRALTGLAARLHDVARLELHKVPCLSGDCAAAAASCMPHVAHLHLDQCRPPLQPDAHFFSGLTALTHLTSLCDVTPATPADVLSLAALTRLTRLELCGDNLRGIVVPDLAPLSRLAQLQALTLSPYGYVAGGHADDVTWLRALAHLETLWHCPPPSVASMHALQSCARLTSLSIVELCQCGWDEVGHPADGAAPPLCLPALHHLEITTIADVSELRGLLRTVRLPALRWLVGTVGLDFRYDADESAADLKEVLGQVSGVSALELLLSDFGEEEDAAWTAAMLEELAALRGELAVEGRGVAWKVRLDSPHWRG